MSDTIILHSIEGVSRKSGIDQHGNQWVEFDVDYFADQDDGNCAICGRRLSSGWLCLDGGDEVCNDHVRQVEGGTLDVSALTYLRTWEDPDGNGFLLVLYDTNATDRFGKSILAYQFFHHGEAVFEGADFHASPLHAIDGDETVAGLLAFLSLKPPDIEPEWFDGYTSTQLAFACAHGEILSLYVEELERQEGGDR
jgi:hypothetical protein